MLLLFPGGNVGLIENDQRAALIKPLPEPPQALCTSKPQSASADMEPNCSPSHLSMSSCCLYRSQTDYIYAPNWLTTPQAVLHLRPQPQSFPYHSAAELKPLLCTPKAKASL